MSDARQEHEVAVAAARAVEKAAEATEAAAAAIVGILDVSPELSVAEAARVAQRRANDAREAATEARATLAADAEPEARRPETAVSEIAALLKPVTRGGQLVEDAPPVTVRNVISTAFSAEQQ
jgi:hypothetical protein